MARTVVAITGASSGIGAAFARKLAAEHDLLLIARHKDRLDELAAELAGQFGCQVDVLAADLASEAGLAAAAERVRAEPHLALLINNAGFGTKGLFWEASLASQEEMHRLHVMATVRLSHAALRNLVARDFGGIINVSSVAAFVRTAGTTSYAATKSWLNVFTESLFLELRQAKPQVTVQALCPGYTYTEFQEKVGLASQNSTNSGFWMTAEAVVNASLAGLARRKLFVVPGWRYQLFTSIFSKLPTGLRLPLEAIGSRRANQEKISSLPPRQVKERN